jgi:hypothetical protein
VGAEPLEVGDEVPRGVGVERDRGICGVGGAASAAALVEQDDPADRGVEQAGPRPVGAPTGPAVQHDGGDALGVPPGLPVGVVAVADVEHAPVVRGAGWIPRAGCGAQLLVGGHDVGG